METSTSPIPAVTRLHLSGNGHRVTFRWDEEAKAWHHNKEDDGVFAVILQDSDLQNVVDRANAVTYLLNAGVLPPEPDEIKHVNRCLSYRERRRMPRSSLSRLSYLGMIVLFMREKRPLVTAATPDKGILTNYEVGIPYSWYSTTGDRARAREKDAYSRIADYAFLLDLFAEWVKHMRTSPRLLVTAEDITWELLHMLILAARYSDEEILDIPMDLRRKLKELLHIHISINRVKEEGDDTFSDYPSRTLEFTPWDTVSGTLAGNWIKENLI